MNKPNKQEFLSRLTKVSNEIEDGYVPDGEEVTWKELEKWYSFANSLQAELVMSVNGDPNVAVIEYGNEVMSEPTAIFLTFRVLWQTVLVLNQTDQTVTAETITQEIGKFNRVQATVLASRVRRELILLNASNSKPPRKTFAPSEEQLQRVRTVMDAYVEKHGTEPNKSAVQFALRDKGWGFRSKLVNQAVDILLENRVD